MRSVAEMSDTEVCVKYRYYQTPLAHDNSKHHLVSSQRGFILISNTLKSTLLIILILYSVVFKWGYYIIYNMSRRPNAFHNV